MADEPLRYMRRYLRVEEDLEPEAEAPTLRMPMLAEVVPAVRKLAGGALAGTVDRADWDSDMVFGADGRNLAEVMATMDQMEGGATAEGSTGRG